MSDLSALIERLHRLAAETDRLAGEMATMSSRTAQLSREASAVMRGAMIPTSALIGALEAATRSCRRAADALPQAGRAARMWSQLHSVQGLGGGQKEGTGRHTHDLRGVPPYLRYPEEYIAPRAVDEQALNETHTKALAVLMASNQSPKAWHRYLSAWIKHVNPRYREVYPRGSHPFKSNCAGCSRAFVSTLAGNAQTAAGMRPNPETGEVSGELDNATEDFYGRKFESTTPADVAEKLTSIGAGAHAVIGVTFGLNVGHMFNAFFDGEQVWFVDCQTGYLGERPPEFPNSVETWEAIFFDAPDRSLQGAAK